MFPRSLKETLVTDFFGGVAQVGMVGPLNFTDEDSVHVDIDSDAELRTNSQPPFVKHYGTVERTRKLDDHETRWRNARLWIASLLLIGGFVIGVALS